MKIRFAGKELGLSLIALLAFVGFSACGGVIVLGVESVAQSPRTVPSIAIQYNSNQTAAGKLENGVLTLHLELRQGDWYPEAETGDRKSVV